MPDTTRIREPLRAFDFNKLFIEELGWDRHTSHLDVPVDGQVFALNAVAQKRGMVVYVCDPLPDGSTPDHATRRKVERQVSKSVLEHLILYVDKQKTAQVWQWVKREAGKPTACREHTYHRNQPGDALIQKLQAIAFSLAEEESLSLVDVTRRTRKAFDVERITKRFYDEFRKQHAAFLKFITGIPVKEDHEWYASVMLNRLMFIYFIQRKGFLDGDHDYLRIRLERTKREHGKDKFYSFYRYFLLRLFHEGLGGRARNPDLDKLLGRIPYLNGGLFDVHELEKPDRYGNAIQIPDEAFEAIFDYFDGWQWHLDERPLRSDKEINPGVLGFIFEKYINQKQMGAYYTEEDITDYISKNTVIPFLFDAARPKCKIAFENPNGPTIWDLLKSDPERYIYPALLHGKDKTLPANIAVGLNDVSQRVSWNKPAPTEFALPTEIWREVVARRKRCDELLAKLAGGEVRDINDLITLNLNIRQFAQDVIENCEGPELLRALWYAIIHVTILDPTCGSGAFLFAALNILEPLYEACLDRMEAFVEELDRSGEKHRPEKFSDFRKVLDSVAAHPNRSYFIFKSIILNNLFGVDIMEEAVEICKLRLFLKLAAQVEPEDTKSNFGIEPLPDIDFNIRAGNTLVGYATADEVRRAFKEGPSGQGKLLLGDSADAYQRFEEQVELADRAFSQFRDMQTEHGMDAKEFVNAKQTLRERLKALQDELNRYLAGDCGVRVPSPSGRGTKVEGDAYATWLKSHQPFHWFVEFYGIINSGGFDVIIGNPPYVEYNKVRNTYQVRHYQTESCGNLYVFVLERSALLVQPTGHVGLIVPIALVSVSETLSARALLSKRFPRSWFSNFAIRPAKLFDGVEQRLTIWLSDADQRLERQSLTTKYLQWYKDERPTLFAKLEYTLASDLTNGRYVPKLGNQLAHEVVRKINQVAAGIVTESLADQGRYKLFFHRTPGYWIRIMDFEPYFRSPTATRSIHHIRELHVRDEMMAKFIGAVVSSSLYFFWFFAMGNCRNLTLEDVKQFKIGRPTSDILVRTGKLFDDLMRDFQQNSFTNSRGDTEFQEFNWDLSKHIIDRIDAVLGEHYGLTDEEVDFVANYDIKIRMGKEFDYEENC